MDRNGTGGRAGTAQALVVRSPAPRDASVPTRVGGRPAADFLTQLIVGADPALRPARSERTRLAAALYARTAARGP